MARAFERLSAMAVVKARKPGMYPDGGGLYLRIGPSGAKSWVFRYRVGDKRRDMGLGPLHVVSLQDARAKATEARRHRLAGSDPVAVRDSERMAARLAAAGGVAFEEAASRYVEAHRAGWKNAKHAAQWGATLEAYAFPVFGDVPVQAVDVGMVLKVLEPIWATKTETASRLRGRIESILDWAKARGYRDGDNPARWRGHLDALLPARTRVAKVEHHAALPYGEVGAFMAALRAHEGVSARALEFCMLTATRTSEAIGARWEEIDLGAGLWTIPAGRIKAGKEHRVPLSERTLEILAGMASVRESDFVFPGGRKGRPLSSMAFLMTLRRMKRDDTTAHGFRSTFRDWAAERTHYPREVCEMSLAHAIGDKVEAAYRRGDLFEKRRRLMDEWARYCATMPAGTGDVVPMRKPQRTS